MEREVALITGASSGIGKELGVVTWKSNRRPLSQVGGGRRLYRGLLLRLGAGSRGSPKARRTLREPGMSTVRTSRASDSVSDDKAHAWFTGLLAAGDSHGEVTPARDIRRRAP